MNEKLARWRPFAHLRLRLEVFEERWTLGGAGFLNAPLGLVGAVAIFSEPKEANESLTLQEASAARAEESHVASQPEGNLTATGTEWKYSEISFDETPGQTLTSVEPVFEQTELLGLDNSIVGSTDSLDILGDLSDQSSYLSNLGVVSATEVAANSEQGNSTRSTSGDATSAPIINLGVSNYAGGNDSLNDAISRGSSSIAQGGFTGSAGNLLGSHGGFYLVPVPEAMIAEGLPDPNAQRITASNRNASTMTGGWNPALRSIMVMEDGSRWFAAEQGTDVNVNSTMVYYRLGEDGWKAAGSVVLPAGIQQNMATVTDGRTIFSYGITGTSVIETRFNTAKPGWNLNTGNNLISGGSAMRPGAQSNYVGAAWHQDTRIVWWTSVGINGTGGHWSYAFNKGGDWTVPIVSGLGGFNDVGYVRAQLDDQSRLHLIGESYRGHYPFGEKYLVSTTLTLGKPAHWTTVLQQTAFTPIDIWHEDSSNAAQSLYRTRTNTIGYSYGLGAANPSTTFAALDGRFIASKNQLALVLSYGNYLEVRVVDRSAATSFIDWNAIEPIQIGFPKSLGKSGLSAIWNVDHSKQPNESDQLEFAICGAYPSYDHLVYYYTV